MARHRTPCPSTDESSYNPPTGDGPYTVGEVVNAVNMPRATLLYYESRGVVEPDKDNGNGYRRYTNHDAIRLMDAILLRNVGILPKDQKPYLQSDPFSVERLDEYALLIEQRIAYLEAQRESLARDRLLQERIGTMAVEYVEPYLIAYDNSEQGYHDVPSDPALDLLLEHLPISSFGGCFKSDFFDLHNRPRWGRTIALRHAHLVPDLQPEHLETIGGCLCLVAYKHENDVFVPNDDTTTVRWLMRSYLDEHGLSAAGSAFVPHVLVSPGSASIPVCLPVRDRPK